MHPEVDLPDMRISITWLVQAMKFSGHVGVAASLGSHPKIDCIYYKCRGPSVVIRVIIDLLMPG